MAMLLLAGCAGQQQQAVDTVQTQEDTQTATEVYSTEQEETQ